MESFIQLVKVSLSEWPTLQLAIEQGMGGSQAREKEEWMVSVLVSFFTDNIGSSVHELSEYIEDIMDNEFDTMIHDSSSDLLASRLVRFYQMVRDGETDKINEVLRTKTEQLEEKRRKSEQVPQLVNCSINSPGSVNRSINSPDSVNTQSPSNQVVNSEDNGQGMDVDDGWTVVGRKGKR